MGCWRTKPENMSGKVKVIVIAGPGLGLCWVCLCHYSSPHVKSVPLGLFCQGLAQFPFICDFIPYLATVCLLICVYLQRVQVLIWFCSSTYRPQAVLLLLFLQKVKHAATSAGYILPEHELFFIVYTEKKEAIHFVRHWQDCVFGLLPTAPLQECFPNNCRQGL